MHIRHIPLLLPPASHSGDAVRTKLLTLYEREACCLQAALSGRQPDSLPALIAAAKPSPQESALVTGLQTKLQSLQVPRHASLDSGFGHRIVVSVLCTLPGSCRYLHCF